MDIRSLSRFKLNEEYVPRKQIAPLNKPARNNKANRIMVELDGLEPTTSCLQSRCSPN